MHRGMIVDKTYFTVLTPLAPGFPESVIDTSTIY